jgi:hypothetical protein
VSDRTQITETRTWRCAACCRFSCCCFASSQYSWSYKVIDDLMSLTAGVNFLHYHTTGCITDTDLGGIPLLDVITCLVLLLTPAVCLYQSLCPAKALPPAAASAAQATVPVPVTPPRLPRNTPQRPQANTAALTPSHSLSRPSRPTPAASLLAVPSTPPHSGTAAAAALSHSPAGSLHFPAHRDLALHTQETVTYDTLSAQKRRRQLHWQDHEEGTGSEYGYSDSSAEEKHDHLSTDSECGDFPPFTDRRTERTLMPPSPDSTPPGSEDERSDQDASTWPTRGVAVAPTASVPLPRRLRPAPLNLQPLGGSSLLVPTTPRLGAPSRSVFADLGMNFPTQEYGADLDCHALTYDHYGLECGVGEMNQQSALSPRHSPEVSYSPSAGIFPETYYSEFAQAPYPYQPDLDYALYPSPPPPSPLRTVSLGSEGRWEDSEDSILHGREAPHTDIRPGSEPSACDLGAVAITAHDGRVQHSSTVHCASLFAGTVCTTSTCDAADAITTLFSSHRPTLRSHSSNAPPLTPRGTVPTSPSTSSSRFGSLRHSLKTTFFGSRGGGKARSRTSGSAATPRQQSRLVGAVLADIASQDASTGDDSEYTGSSARAAALAFDPDAYYSLADEIDAADAV